MDLSARLGPAWVSPRQLRPRGVPVEVRPRHLIALHPLRDFGESGQVFAFRHEGRGGTVQPGSAVSPKHARHRCASQHQSREVFTKPRTSLSLGSRINQPWPPPALASQRKQRLHHLQGEHLLRLWGKLRQGSRTTHLRAQ